MNDLVMTDQTGFDRHREASSGLDPASPRIEPAATSSPATAIEWKPDVVAHEAEIEVWKLALVALRTDNAVIITDAAGRIEWANQGFSRVTGYTLDEVRGVRPGTFLQGPGTDTEVVALMRRRIAEGRGFRVEVLNYAKGGRPYWLSIDCQPARDAAGVVTHFMAIESDITERKEMETRVLEQLRISHRLNLELVERREELDRLNALLIENGDDDSLTGLKSRGYLQGWLDATLEGTTDDGLAEVSVILLDIDDFHEFNASFGSSEGDEVLRTVARILDDHSGPGRVAARMGGEEFALLLLGAGEPEARAIASRIREAIEGHDWPQRPVTASLGVATVRRLDRDRDVVEMADHALNQSKWAGRNRVTHHVDLDPTRPSRRFRA